MKNCNTSNEVFIYHWHWRITKENIICDHFKQNITNPFKLKQYYYLYFVAFSFEIIWYRKGKLLIWEYQRRLRPLRMLSALKRFIVK